MQYARKHRRRAYFVYVVPPTEDELHIETPRGGVTALASNPIDAYDIAWQKANSRFARRPGEILVLIERRTKVERLQARLLELVKQRADNKFRIEMMV